MRDARRKVLLLTASRLPKKPQYPGSTGAPSCHQSNRRKSKQPQSSVRTYLHYFRSRTEPNNIVRQEAWFAPQLAIPFRIWLIGWFNSCYSNNLMRASAGRPPSYLVDLVLQFLLFKQLGSCFSWPSLFVFAWSGASHIVSRTVWFVPRLAIASNIWMMGQAAPGSSWQLLAAPGSSWEPRNSSWQLLVARGNSWQLLAAPCNSWQLLLMQKQLLAIPNSSEEAPGSFW